jgi:hypothetical protein
MEREKLIFARVMLNHVHWSVSLPLNTRFLSLSFFSISDLSPSSSLTTVNLKGAPGRQNS